MINILICLTDIPKSKITTSEKNGKKYLSVIIDKRKEADRYGNSHTAYVNQTKEEREAKGTKSYIGNGKEYIFDKKVTKVETAEVIKDNNDDLQF